MEWTVLADSSGARLGLHFRVFTARRMHLHALRAITPFEYCGGLASVLYVDAS